jgi:ABC-type arginine transport system permease subunit
VNLHSAPLVAGTLAVTVRASYPAHVSERSDRLRDAFTALDQGSVDEFEALFLPEAQWLGVPGSGPEGETPT